MTKTVVLLNPMGTDVTNFVNHTSMVPQLLNGTVAAPTDTVYTLPYDNTSGVANVEAGVALLDAKLKATTGQVLVFGYSEGCQIADWWLTNQGSTPATGVDPANVTFLLIANANRKYGGFVYNHPIFDGVGYTAGKPALTPYTVTDFARQYDGVSDFPTATPIVDALVGLETVGTDANAVTGAMNAVAAVVNNTTYANAALNAITGLVVIHNNYLQVEVDNPANVALQEGNITWVWSPTYPVPLLGIGATFPQSDYQLRTQIEQAYSRPVQIPMPNYASNTGWSVEPFPVPVTTAPVTGWWAELHVTAHITVTPHLSASTGRHGVAAFLIHPTVTASGHAVHPFSASETVTPSISPHVTLELPRGGTTVISPQVSAAVRLIKPISATITVTPTLSGTGKDRDGVSITVAPHVSVSMVLNGHIQHVAATITPTVAAAGRVTRFATEAITVTPHVTASAVVYRNAAVAKTVTPTVGVVAGISRHGAAAKTIAPTVAAAVHAESHPTVTVSPSVAVSARVLKGAAISKTVTPTVTAGGQVTRHAAAALTVTPSVAGVARDRDGASLIVTPTVSATAHAIKAVTVAVTVHPTVSAGDKTRAAVSKTVTPAVATAGVVTRTGTVTKTITPSVSVSAAAKKAAAVAKTITPTVTASVVLIKVGNVAKAITSSVTVAGSVTAGVSFDAVGAGNSALSNASTLTWLHSATSGAYVVVGVLSNKTAANISGVQYGSTTMTQLGTIGNGNAPTHGSIFLYGVNGVSSGSTTVTVTFSSTGSPVAGNSVSYTGVTSAGTAQTTSGDSTSLSQSTTGGGTNKMTVQIFGTTTATTAISSYSGTSRYNSGTTDHAPMVLGDSTTANKSFTATGVNDRWAGIAVVLS